MAVQGELLFPAINLNVCVTTLSSATSVAAVTRFMRATGAMVGGNCVLICGYGSDQGCAYKRETAVCVDVWVV